ncbi:hypothetical protein LP52_03750 [Streptomonospora alba]|uniref:Uncharacterized protein n=1 Tax=Streptomonospora alba TaxID=183763 RepID=A0A0C2JT98_9ACTN|nr:hypothetical protein [Streptomonospora alba]KII00058.1 hypothetical protein LP52_03750 [Streptomonospora alba]
MIKPVNVWEAVMWASAAVALVCAGITAVVQDDGIGAWTALVAAMIIAVAAGGERRRVLQRRNGACVAD